MRLRRCVSANRKTIGCAPRFAAARLSSGRGRVELISAALGSVAVSFTRLPKNGPGPAGCACKAATPRRSSFIWNDQTTLLSP